MGGGMGGRAKERVRAAAVGHLSGTLARRLPGRSCGLKRGFP